MAESTTLDQEFAELDSAEQQLKFREMESYQRYLGDQNTLLTTRCNVYKDALLRLLSEYRGGSDGR